MAIHLNGSRGFDPATSYASVIITVPQLDDLHQSFKEGLRRPSAPSCLAKEAECDIAEDRALGMASVVVGSDPDPRVAREL